MRKYRRQIFLNFFSFRKAKVVFYRIEKTAINTERNLGPPTCRNFTTCSNSYTCFLALHRHLCVSHPIEVQDCNLELWRFVVVWLRFDGLDFIIFIESKINHKIWNVRSYLDDDHSAQVHAFLTTCNPNFPLICKVRSLCKLFLINMLEISNSILSYIISLALLVAVPFLNITFHVREKFSFYFFS